MLALMDCRQHGDLTPEYVALRLRVKLRQGLIHNPFDKTSAVL